MLEFIPSDVVDRLGDEEKYRAASTLCTLAAHQGVTRILVRYFLGVSKPESVTIATGNAPCSVHGTYSGKFVRGFPVVVEMIAAIFAQLQYLCDDWSVDDVVDTLHLKAGIDSRPSPALDLTQLATDSKKALIDFNIIHDDPEIAAGGVCHFGDRIRELILQHWPVIESNAEFLLRHGVMHSEEIEKAFGSYWRLGYADPYWSRCLNGYGREVA
jgi:hypothetical protein